MQGEMQRDHQGNKGNIEFRRTLKEMQRKSKGNSKEIKVNAKEMQRKFEGKSKEMQRECKGNPKGDRKLLFHVSLFHLVN